MGKILDREAFFVIRFGIIPAPVAQWQSDGLLIRWSQVQVLPGVLCDHVNFPFSPQYWPSKLGLFRRFAPVVDLRRPEDWTAEAVHWPQA